MKALILAAGKGNRLGEASEEKPKALVCVGAKELLSYQMKFLKAAKIQKVGVVVGFKAPLMTDFIKEVNPKIEIFENKNYEKGNILSLKAALSFLDDAFLLLNVDHLYPKGLLPSVLEQAKGITAACDFDRPVGADDMKVRLDSKGHLKEMDKTLKDPDGGYIGMTFCPASKRNLYFQGLETTLAEFGPKTSVEKILTTLVKQGETISIADTSGIRWLEIDTVEDLKRAEATLKKNPNFLE